MGPARIPNLTLYQWENVLGQARQTRLLARVARHFEDHGIIQHLADGPRKHLEGALKLAERQQHEVRWELDCIRRALFNLKLPVVALKGAAYLAAKLPPADGRLFSDIDIMVPIEQIDLVESALFSAGWISDERDPYNQRYYRQWMHEIPPLRHVLRNTFIDLHHTITPPTSRFQVNGKKLLARAQPVADNPNLLVLAPEDMVLHSAVHLFQDGDLSHGLRDLLDLNDLILHFGKREEFVDELLNRAEDLDLRIPLYHSLLHIKRLFSTNLPNKLLGELESLGPGNLSRAVMLWSLTLALRPMHPSCNTTWTSLARLLLYVRAHALRMPAHTLVPHLLRKAYMGRFPNEVH